MNNSEKLNVPLCQPRLDGNALAYAQEVIESGWLAEGKFNHEMSERLAELAQRKHCMLFNSWTSAAYLLLKALDIRGEVIIPSFTFVASANIVESAGARVAFADIGDQDLALDPAAVESLIGPQTEALMVVHYAGMMADMPALQALADKHGLALIEDSAETLGAQINGIPPGKLGYGIFSFFPTKNITTGEGGAITLDDDDVFDRLRTLAAHGIPRDQEKKRPWHRAATVAGYNMRMSQLNAALGVAQLEQLDAMTQTRRHVAEIYITGLSDLPELRFHQAPQGRDHVYQMFVVRVPIVKRDELVLGLNQLGVGASVHFDPPVHQQPAYANLDRRSTPLDVTERSSLTCITLPCGPTTTPEQAESVVRCFRQLYLEN